MYRRIELIEDNNILTDDLKWRRGVKGGTSRTPFFYDVAEAEDIFAYYQANLPRPSKRITRNCRFYFTKLGWDLFGRKVIAGCQRHRRRYRVIAIKEKAADVVYIDEYQVAVRPRLKRGTGGKPSSRRTKDGHI